jgi:hypothetical protein
MATGTFSDRLGKSLNFIGLCARNSIIFDFYDRTQIFHNNGSAFSLGGVSSKGERYPSRTGVAWLKHMAW